jgi:hypothetical protein
MDFCWTQRFTLARQVLLPLEPGPQPIPIEFLKWTFHWRITYFTEYTNINYLTQWIYTQCQATNTQLKEQSIACFHEVPIMTHTILTSDIKD